MDLLDHTNKLIKVRIKNSKKIMIKKDLYYVLPE